MSPVSHPIRVPEISRFFGIVIRMYFDDHPLPHFHAFYAGDEAEVAIDTGDVVGGRVAPRAVRLISEWRRLHLEELREDWRLAVALRPLRKIAPLR